MKLRMKLASGLAVLSLGLVPATGMADGVDYTPDPPKEHPAHPHGGPQGKAYGYYCKGESRKHAKGEKGTAFSRCVKDVNRLRKEERRAEKKQRQEEKRQQAQV